MGVIIVAGFLLKEGKRYRNTAIVINRAGVILGRYYKCYLSAEEMARGVAPCSDVVGVETDVGRVGLSISFDINWPHHFASVFAKGVDYSVWQSRHDGGLPLHAAAMNTRMPILTSTLDSPAKVIDCMGRCVCRDHRCARDGAQGFPVVFVFEMPFTQRASTKQPLNALCYIRLLHKGVSWNVPHRCEHAKYGKYPTGVRRSVLCSMRLYLLELPVSCGQLGVFYSFVLSSAL
jgi:hypothetical protein